MTYVQIIGELLQADFLRVGPSPAELCSLVVEHPPLRVVGEAQVRQHLGPPLSQRVRQHQTLVVRVLINCSKLNRKQCWDPDPHDFLGLPDPDPLFRCTDPAPDPPPDPTPDPSHF